MQTQKIGRGVIAFALFGLLLSPVLHVVASKSYDAYQRTFNYRSRTPLAALLAAQVDKSASPAIQKKQIQKLNSDLKKAGKQYNSAKTVRSKEQRLTGIKTLTQKRTDLLLSIMEKDPEVANQAALSEQDKSSLPKSVRDALEKNVEKEGELEVLIEEDFENKKVKIKHFLQTDDGQRYNLYLPQASKRLISRQRVKAKGIELQQNIAALSESSGGIQILSEPSTASVLTSAFASTTKRTVVILFNFSDDTSQPRTKEYVEDVVFNQVDSYYQENSYNKLDITGGAFGYYTLPINKTCDEEQIKTEAIKISDSNIDFFNYDTIVFAGPIPYECGWQGRSTIGAVNNITSDGNVIAGNAWIPLPSMDVVWGGLYVIGHELGHTYGAWHANVYNCDGSIIKQSGCGTDEYGDGFDIMGNFPAHMNGYHKEILRFLEPGNIVNVTSSGSYTISPMETSGTEPKVLKISRGNGTFLYIEYRQRMGADFYFSTSSVDGALIHIAPLYMGTGDTQLLDMTPTMTRWSSADSALDVGKSFTDSEAAAITVTNQTASGLTVNIDIFTRKNPPCGNYGDVNGSGYITRADIDLISESVIGKIVLTAEQKKRADVDVSGSVTGIDAMRVSQYYSDKINSFPICSLPDLKTENIFIQKEEGNAATFTVNYKNYGYVTVASKFGFGFLQTGGVIVEDVSVSDDSNYYLAPGAVGSAKVKIRYDAPGIYKVNFNLDDGNAVKEVDETNNGISLNLRLPPCGSYGDADGDGYVTDYDMALISEFVAGSKTPTDEQKRVSDVTADGQITGSDVLRVTRYISGLINTFPICSVQ